MYPRLISILLNLGHTLDHLVLLIFAAAVATIAAELGVERWEDLMPYGAPAFFFFGLGSLPAGKLGDLWGRRQMMLLYFIGMGISSLLVSQAQSLAAIVTAGRDGLFCIHLPPGRHTHADTTVKATGQGHRH